MGGKGVGGAVQAVRIANDSCVDMRTEQTTLKNLQTPCEKRHIYRSKSYMKPAQAQTWLCIYLTHNPLSPQVQNHE